MGVVPLSSVSSMNPDTDISTAAPLHLGFVQTRRRVLSSSSSTAIDFLTMGLPSFIVAAAPTRRAPASPLTATPTLPLRSYPHLHTTIYRLAPTRSRNRP